MVEPAEKHGLSTSLLKKASEEVARALPVRHCLLVVKNGVLVHESYPATGVDKDTKLSSDSMGKSFTGILVGLVVSKGLLDLDRPIIQYGVKPIAPWNISGIDRFPEVTTKHLLAQVAGSGFFKPGFAWTYDSNMYLRLPRYLP